jgi:hypothetical protein
MPVALRSASTLEAVTLNQVFAATSPDGLRIEVVDGTGAVEAHLTLDAAVVALLRRQGSALDLGADLARAREVREVEMAVRAQTDRMNNVYEHDACGSSWNDEHSCACDDECPACGASISPLESYPLIELAETHKRGTFTYDQFTVACTHDILVLVHPGSSCGSAAFHLGEEEARAARDRLCSEVRGWRGGLVVIDGFLSDELDTAPVFKSAIEAALARAAEAGYVSLRIESDDPGDADTLRQITARVPVGAIFTATGAWLEPECSGCVGAAIEGLQALGFSADASDDAVRLQVEPADRPRER